MEVVVRVWKDAVRGVEGVVRVWKDVVRGVEGVVRVWKGVQGVWKLWLECGRTQ